MVSHRRHVLPRTLGWQSIPSNAAAKSCHSNGTIVLAVVVRSDVIFVLGST